MGYNTTFDGFISIEPSLNQEEINFLAKFAATRRMNRHNGPYYVGGTGCYGQGYDPDIIDYNCPPPGQPNLYCSLVLTDDGDTITCETDTNFYDSVEWMRYIIEHFLCPAALAKDELTFLQANHVLNGTINAQGEEPGDFWQLVVEDNKVSRKEGRIVYN